MSPPPDTNPNSLKIRLAYRFLHNLNTLSTTNPTSNHTDQIHRRSHRVKIAAYASMAYVTGSRRAWSRAILCKIRNRRRVYLARSRSRNKRLKIDCSNPKTKREFYVDPNIGNSGLEVKLRRLVPGAETMDACGLLDETADYIKCLATQVEVMKTLVDFYSTI